MPPKYINQQALNYLERCFPGLIPARVVEEALREKAAREGRLIPQSRHRWAPHPTTPRPAEPTPRTRTRPERRSTQRKP